MWRLRQYIGLAVTLPFANLSSRGAVLNESNSYDVAVIGMAGRFPGAESPQEFWENVCNGRNCITYFGRDELRKHGVDERNLADPNYVCAAPVLRDVELFDAQFFGITPREAELMDPQQRLFLECCWEALENAGYDPATYPEPIGLFAGARTDTYLVNLLSHRDMVDAVGMFHLGLGNDLAFLTTRVSHLLNLRGPSCSLHTACSTSLIAVHLACQSLLLDECRMALAGGVAVNVPHFAGYKYEEGSVESPDGYCRVFDSAARGTVFGSGIGLVVLKRLQDALADGDSIQAVIRGSAMNNDGSAKASFTAPGIQGQIRVIREALRNAQVSAKSISYVECHGTGTLLGDAIEVRALSKAFGGGETDTCALGSVKSNVGHLDAAAGVAGLIKVVLSLKHRMLPPSLHFNEPNPQIQFNGTPFYVNTSLRRWTTSDGEPRRAGVSAFGVGGTNAHVVVEEAPAVPTAERGRSWQLLPLSARSEKALGISAGRLAAHLKQHEDQDLADVAYTLQVGRHRFGWRTTVACSGREEALSLLEQTESAIHDGNWNGTESQEETVPSVVFMFPGQGAQYQGMGRELYREEETFRRYVDECSKILRPHLGVELTDLLYGSGAQQLEGQEQGLEQTWLAQPALLVVEYALAQLWKSWGIEPEALLGHSVGEYTAACLSGVMKLEEALRLVAARGRLMQQGKPGGMLAVALGAHDLHELLAGSGLELAAINAPDLCTVAGPEADILEMEKRLQDAGVNWQRLRTSHAFHCRMLDGIVDEYLEEVKKIELSAPKIPFVSNVTGQWIKVEEAQDPGYWVRQMREAVRFGMGVNEIASGRDRIFLEVGPGQTLRRLVLKQPPEGRGCLQLASMAGQGEEQRSMVTALGRMWEIGAEVHWKSVQKVKRRRVPLPTYPFERKRYWTDPQPLVALRPENGVSTGPEITSDMNNWFWTPSWKIGAAPPEQSSDRQKSWLVFLDELGVAGELCSQLEAGQSNVIRVRRGTGFQKVSSHAFVLNPRVASDYSGLMKSLTEAGQKISHVVHCWSLDPENNPFVDSQLAAAGLDTVLYATQAVIRNQPGNECSLNIISTSMVQVESGDALLAEKAGILTFCRVVPQEHQNVQCRCIDVAVPKNKAETKQIAGKLGRELQGKIVDSVVAYRGRNRWVEWYERFLFEDKVQPRRTLAEGAIYLVLGGLGGVGLTIAAQLAASAKSNFLLVGRSTLPSRQHWAELADETADKTLAHRLRVISEMEGNGAKVETISADISDRTQMQGVFDFAYRKFGRIDGVIHAAGATHHPSSFCSVLETDMECFEVQARPKLNGIGILRELTRGRDIGFVLLVSSNATVVGGLGFLSYVAANLFMDAHALQEESSASDRTTTWICSKWDHWPEVEARREHFDVQFEESAVIRALERKHLYAMTREEAQQATLRILNSFESGEVFVSKGNLRKRLEPSPAQGSVSFKAQETFAAPAAARNSRPNLKSVYIAPRNEMERRVTEVWQEFLGLDRIGVHDDFFELGGHSLLATKLIAAIRSSFNSDLTLTRFFAGPTVANIAEAMAQVEDAAANTAAFVSR